MWLPELDILQSKDQITETKQKQKQQKESNPKSRGMVVLPYVKGVSEKVSRVMKSPNISTVMESYNTLRQQLVHPKDKRDPSNTTQVVYEIPCLNCDKTYVGETGRKFSIWLSEHRTELTTVDERRMNTRAGRQE